LLVVGTIACTGWRGEYSEGTFVAVTEASARPVARRCRDPDATGVGTRIMN